MKHLTLIGLIALAPLASLADDVTPLNVKPGLWEDTVTTQAGGMMGAIPDDVLAKMPPERREQLEKAMKGAMAPHTMKACVTPDQIKNGRLYQDRSNNACKQTITSSSSDSITFHIECNSGRSQTVADGHFQAIDSGTVKGEITGTTTMPDGRTIPSKTTFSGKWLSSDCGNVK